MKHRRKKFIKFLKGKNVYNEFLRLFKVWIKTREFMSEYSFREKYYTCREVSFAEIMNGYMSVESLIKEAYNPIQEAFPWENDKYNHISWRKLAYMWQDIQEKSFRQRKL